jgi:hypothetical protein
MKKFNIVLILTSLFLIGCLPLNESFGPPPKNHILTRDEMSFQIFGALRSYPITGDASYSVFDIDKLEKYYDEYRKDLFEKGVVRWDRQFDCNRFSQSFASFLQIKHLVNSRKEFGHGEALAVAEVYYKKDSGGGHAINLILTKDGFVFFEPQTGRVSTLSSTEKESISLIKF